MPHSDDAVDFKDSAPLRVGRITIYPERYEVYVDGERIELTLTQFRLINAMAKRPGWVLSASQFSLKYGQTPRDRTTSHTSIKHHIATLRRKLGTAAVQVETVRGQGYRLTGTAVNGPPAYHENQSES